MKKMLRAEKFEQGNIQHICLQKRVADKLKYVNGETHNCFPRCQITYHHVLVLYNKSRGDGERSPPPTRAAGPPASAEAGVIATRRAERRAERRADRVHRVFRRTHTFVPKFNTCQPRRRGRCVRGGVTELK